MAVLHFNDVNEQIAQAYLNAPLSQQQRLKRILEEAILLWMDTSNFVAISTQTSIVSTENEAIIQHTPGVCGGEACIRQTRIPVWTLVSLRSQGATDNELLKEYPSLTQTDLEAAWHYYQNHQNDIEQTIAKQDD
jgi:type III restriction enzyme